MAANNRRRPEFRKILVPTDFTDASIDAAAYALVLSRRYKARLYLLHVVDTTEEASGFYVPHLSYDNIEGEMKAAAGEMLRRFRTRRFRGVKQIETRVLTGRPHKAILRYAKSEGVDLIVMGTYGTGGIDKVLFGSTTERVMRKSNIPVLVVPPPK